jgi:hypothetical protein
MRRGSSASCHLHFLGELSFIMTFRDSCGIMSNGVVCSCSATTAAAVQQLREEVQALKSANAKLLRKVVHLSTLAMESQTVTPQATVTDLAMRLAQLEKTHTQTTIANETAMRTSGFRVANLERSNLNLRREIDRANNNYEQLHTAMEEQEVRLDPDYDPDTDT